MTFRLGTSATYHEHADLVDVAIYVEDQDAGVFKPQLIKEGRARLRARGVKIDEDAEFDKRFGTSDGSVRVFFVHPSSINDLSVHTEVTVINEELETEQDFYFDTQVVLEEADKHPFGSQPLEGTIYGE